MAPRKIDLSSVDRESFEVKERDGRFLVVPSPKKHIWSDDELHLRSLLTDGEGNVLSAGWPKFFNAGENPQHDEEFRLALQRGAVEFSLKLDGSLVCLDYLYGKSHFRTRGNFDLGDFEEPVMRLIEESYPRLLSWYTKDNFSGDIMRRHYTILFEYVGPENPIVIHYEEPELYLLGIVAKDTLKPAWDSFILSAISEATGVPTAPVLDLPQSLGELESIVRNWADKEGVVARFPGSLDGIHVQPRLLKVKADQYVRLHAIKFRLEGKVAKLAYLLGITSMEHAAENLATLGIDFEGLEYIRPELEAYLTRLADVDTRFLHFVGALHLTAQRCRDEHSDPKAARKTYVEMVRAWLGHNDDYAAEILIWFPAAMRVYDGEFAEAHLQVQSRLVLDESPNVVRAWQKNSVDVLDAVFHTPIESD